MTIETLPFEHRPRNSIANNLDKINELVDWANLDTHLYASATGERVTVDDASSLKGLQVHGRSVQDGTPTPDAPVPVQVVEGPLSLVIGDASVAINLQGNTLASLPDGTRDELHVDSAGRVWIERRVNVAVYDGSNDETITQSATNQQRYNLPAMNGANQAYNCYNNVAVYRGNVSDSGMFSVSNGYMYLNVGIGTIAALRTWLADNHVTVAYPLVTPQTIDLGYIDQPAIPSGSVVTVSASLTPEFQLDWWIDSGITTLVNDLIAYIDYKTEG